MQCGAVARLSYLAKVEPLPNVVEINYSIEDASKDKLCLEVEKAFVDSF